MKEIVLGIAQVIGLGFIGLLFVITMMFIVYAIVEVFFGAFRDDSDNF